MSRVSEIRQADVGVYSQSEAGSTVAMYEFNLESFRDPLGNKYLRAEVKDGTDPKVQEWIKQDPRYRTIMDNVLLLAADHRRGGGSWLSIGFRDHHGKWKSRAMAELAAAELGALGLKVWVLHVGR